MDEWSRPGVYGIFCRPVQKVYVGMAKISIERRVDEHLKMLEGGRHHVPAMQALYDGFGANAFTVGIIHPVREGDHLRAIEIRAQSYYAAKGWLINNPSDQPPPYRPRRRSNRDSHPTT